LNRFFAIESNVWACQDEIFAFNFPLYLNLNDWLERDYRFFSQICHCHRREGFVWLDWIWNNFIFNLTQNTFFRSLKVKSISRLKLLQLALSCFSFWSEIIFYNIFLINERFKKNIFLINERLNVKRIKTRFYNNEKRKQHSRTDFSW
jgi:hypothetical protein